MPGHHAGQVRSSGNLEARVWRRTRHLGSKRFGQILSGTFWKREAIDYRVAAAVGMGDLVPARVAATIRDQAGSLQEFRTGRPGELLFSDKRYGRSVADVERVLFYDYVIDNTDRHPGNWRVSPNGKISPIDYGLAFPRVTPRQLTIDLADGLPGMAIEIPERIKALWRAVERQTPMLVPGLSRRSIAQTQARLERALSART